MSSSVRKHHVRGIPGTLTVSPIRENGTHAKQQWVSEWRLIPGGDQASMRVTIRFDDELRNGHNSFSITCDHRERRRDVGGGADHDAIAEEFPELADLTRWHLSSTEGPMHYVENTIYLAGNRDHYGKVAGEPTRFEPAIAFDDHPYRAHVDRKLANVIAKAIESGEPLANIKPVEVPHREGQFTPQWTITGLKASWGAAPFNSEEHAKDFCAALAQAKNIRIDEIPIEYSEGKERELDAARRAANWPDATDEQLCAPPDELKAMLIARQSDMNQEFKQAIASIGFEWPSDPSDTDDESLIDGVSPGTKTPSP